jgi:DHA1 family inner membrane transport protein
VLCAVFMIGAFCFYTAENLPIGLLPVIAADLHVSLARAGLLVTVHGLTVAICSIPLTLAVRRIPRRYLISGLLVAFVASLAAAALAVDYWQLLAAREVNALAQSVFWAVGVVTAAGLFPERMRGRVLSVLFAGSSLSTVAGVPSGTWLGQRFGWRLPFACLAATALVGLVVIAVLLPTSRPADDPGSAGGEPSRSRFTGLLVAYVFVVAGAFTLITYINPFLTSVGRFAESSVGPLLSVRGLGGVAALVTVAILLDRRPAAVLPGAVAVLVCVQLGLYALGTTKAAALVLLVGLGFAMNGLVTTTQYHIMRLAPGDTGIASAAGSVAFNIGIGSGSFAGSLLLPDVRATALLGAVFTGAGLVIATVVVRNR